MPAIILAKAVQRPDAEGNPHRWEIGELVAAYPVDHDFGTAVVPESGRWFHITVTDRTPEQAQAFIEDWSHKVTRQILNVTPQPGGKHKYEVRLTSSRVSPNGKNAFRRADGNALLADLNELDEVSASYVSHTNTTLDLEILARQSDRDDVLFTAQAWLENIRYKRSRYKLTPSAIAFLQANGGRASGDAATIATFLRDRLADD